MMANVSEFKKVIDHSLIKKLFHKFTCVYGVLWTNRLKTDAEWEDCCITWYDGLQSFSFDVLRKAVSQSFLVHKDYPPTLGQLVDICLHVSGVPAEHEVIASMIRKDFNHPLVKLIYDKVGNWTLSNAKPEEIKGKVKTIYGECLGAYRENPTAAWEALESFKALPPAQPLLPKIPKPKEILSFREQLKKYVAMSEVEKSKLTPQSHPVWNKDAITRGSQFFDQKVHDERKMYLVKLDETVSATLPHEDQYDRIRFIREDIASKAVETYRATHPAPEGVKMPPRSYNGAKTVFRGWMGD